jgi:hypothetical protein
VTAPQVPVDPALGALADVCLAPLFQGPASAGRIMAVTTHAVYARLDARSEAAAPPVVVTLLGPGAVRVPAALSVTSGWERVAAAAPVGAPIELARGSVVLPGLRLRPARWYDSRVPRVVLSAAPPRAAGLGLPPLPGVVAPPAAAFAAALAGECSIGAAPPSSRDREPALADAVRRLTGLGPGLTPAGDDVLAGALVALVAAQADVRPFERLLLPLLSRTTVVSAALLRHACAGRAVPELARFVAAAARGRPDAVMVEDLVKVGSSSGTALAHGALAGLRALDPASAAAPGRASRPPAQEVA